MTHSKLTNKIRLSAQNSSRNGAKIDRFIVHHAAATNMRSVEDMMVYATREVSANYVVGDTITCVVDEDRRAWTSASAHWDGRAVTVETINNSTNGWTVSSKTFDNLARLIADASYRYGFPVNDQTVITHQELYTRYGASYPTACPGDLQRRKAELLALARKYRGQGGTGIPARNYNYGLSFEARKKFHAFLKSKGFINTKSGLNWGAAEVAGAQKYLISAGLLPKNYSVDGIPGENYGRAIQTLARKGGYKGPIDGLPGGATSKGLIAALAQLTAPKHAAPKKPAPKKSTPVKKPAGITWHSSGGVAVPSGKLMVRIQTALRKRGRYNGPADGVAGPNTIKGVQLSIRNGGGYTGPIDGTLGPAGARAIQVYARDFGGYKGPIDGDPREASWTSFAVGLERP